MLGKDLASGVLACLGGVLFSVGVYRLSAAAAHSAVFHAFLGLVLLLLYSDHARLVLLRQIPRPLLVYLYRKSLLDILIEPSPVLKAYTIVALSSVLDVDELRRLTEALPRECEYMRRPGLIHMLPEGLQRALYSHSLHHELELEQADVLAQEGSLVGEVAEADEGDHFFVEPSFLRGGGVLAAGDGRHDDDDDDDADAAAEAEGEAEMQVVPVATHIVAAAASAPAPGSSGHSAATTEFERLVAEMASRRVNSAGQQAAAVVARRATALASELGWFVCSGGSATSEHLALTGAACGAASLSLGWLLAASPAARGSAVRAGMSHDAIFRTVLGAARAAGWRAAALCGAALAVRQAAHVALVLEEFAGPSRGVQLQPRVGGISGAVSTLSRVCAKAYARCLRLYRGNPVYASAVSASLLVTALLAWSLKTRWRRMRWLALVILARIQQSAQALRDRLG